MNRYEPTDDDIVGYHHIFSVSRLGALVRTAGCRHSSTALIAATVADAHRLYDDPADVANVDAAALSVEQCPPALIEEALEAWVGGAANLHCALLAANHPHIGPNALHWWDRLGEGAARAALLTNHAADPELLERHWEENPKGVAANPATPPLLLAEILGDGHAHWEGSVHHPAIAEDLLQIAVRSNDPELRARAYRNPTHTRETLRGFYAAELTRQPYSVTASNALAALLGIQHPADPMSATIAEVLFSPLRTDLAEIVAALPDDHVAAAASLVQSGFVGTVGELLEVSATFA